MPYNVALNDILEARVLCWEPSDQQLGVNVIHYSVAVLAGTVTLTNLATQLDTNINAAYKAWLGATATYRGVGMTKIFPAPRTVEEHTTANTGAGTGGAKLCPQQVSGINRYYTALAGRQNRGRMYPPFPSDTWANNDGNMTAGGQTALAAIATAYAFAFTYTAGPNSATCVMGLWGRTTHVFRVFAQVVSPATFATQRRRGQLGRTNLLPW